MERDTILRSLAASGTDTAPRRLTELAAELDIPAADLLVVAGHPMPADLLPPVRDANAMRRFAYLATFCDHSQLGALDDFIRSLPRTTAQDLSGPPRWPSPHPPQTPFATVLGGLMHNRGFSIRELPFMGLSLSTIHGMLRHANPSPHRQQQLRSMAGVLGWSLRDIFAIADEPYSADFRPRMHCRHLGRVFMTAVPLTTAQLVEAATEADRLSARKDHGAWQPISEGFATECPDFP